MPADLFTRSLGRPAVVAHRGSGPGIGVSGFPENTVEAFVWAARNGADWMEFDVQASADGDLVVHHNVFRDGQEVSRSATRDLLQAGLCTLADVHAALPAHVGFNLDVKVGFADASAGHPDLFGRVAEWAAPALSGRELLITSFCPSVAAMAEGIPAGLLRTRTSYYYESVVAGGRMGTAAVSVHAEDVLAVRPHLPPAADVGAFARDRGIAVLAWGVQPGTVAALLDAGVTGLCTDHVPQVAEELADLLSAGTQLAA